MRLTEKEKSAILESVRKLDPDADIYLFGSRTDDQKKELDRMMLPQFMMMGVIMFLMIVILFLILNRKNI